MVKFNKQKTRNLILLATLLNPGTIYFPTDSDTIFVNNKEYGKSATSTLYNRKGVKATYAQLPSSGNELYDVWNVLADHKDYMFYPEYTVSTFSGGKIYHVLENTVFVLDAGGGNTIYGKVDSSRMWRVMYTDEQGNVKTEGGSNLPYYIYQNGSGTLSYTTDSTNALVGTTLSVWIEVGGINLDGYATTEAVTQEFDRIDEDIEELLESTVKLSQFESFEQKTDADVQGLKNSMTTLGNLRIRNLSTDYIPNVCNSPLILIADGVPSENNIPIGWNTDTMGEWTGVPMFIGQLYINKSVTSSGLYYAKGDNSISDWVNA